MNKRAVAQSGRAPFDSCWCASRHSADEPKNLLNGGRGFESLPARPISRFDFRWNEPLGRVCAPYMHRYMINLWLFSVRVHIWHRSDDKRFMHDHAFDFLTIVMRGGYKDVSESKVDVLKAGSVRFRKAEHIHFVGWPAPGTITLLICGPRRRKWGFFVKEKIMRPLRYFSRYGHPCCDEL